MLVIVDFDCRHPLPGDISLVAAWLWRGRRKKKEKEGEDVGEPRHVMIRLETYAAFNDFTECHRLGKASATSPPFLLVASNKEKTTFFSSFEAMRRRGGDVAEATMSPRLLPICVERRKGVDFPACLFFIFAENYALAFCFPADVQLCDEVRTSPKGLRLVAHEPSSVSSLPGSHMRGSTLRASAAGNKEVDLLLPGTGRYTVFFPFDILVL
ncbi:hypothetical protein BHE74_00025462 [Ensete ventricosum]|nr:hypothetical protein BHE74_00025462 [Ensete ventricosum]RZS05097.1 hypothetical protein BHM03_00035543 [Ensete ventricosum]